MSDRKKQLLLFTRYPEPGSTKTRLVPELGEEGAAQLQKRMTEHIFHRCLSLAEPGDITLVVHYNGNDARVLRSWLGEQPQYIKQRDGDIGKRMHHAFEQAFARGGEQVVLIGSDVPAITKDILCSAFTLLHDHDAVIGPAEDGGYYLIGLNADAGDKLPARLFSAIPWSTERVYNETMKVLQQLKATVAVLPQLKDIDRPEDLEEARKWIAR